MYSVARFGGSGGRASGLYSCYFLRMGVGLIHVETLSDNEGKKKAKRQDLTPSPAFRRLRSERRGIAEVSAIEYWIARLYQE